MSGRGGAGALGGLTRLAGVGGVGVGVLVGDPREQVGLAGEQRGVLGGVAAEGRRASPGETVEELGDLAGGDRSGCRVVGAAGVARGSWSAIAHLGCGHLSGGGDDEQGDDGDRPGAVRAARRRLGPGRARVRDFAGTRDGGRDVAGTRDGGRDVAGTGDGG